ncbi:MAG: rhomboid family intramembrane serine protease [Phycisphaerae bacterium]|nr:rhomboid family intramembrane serine protease [Phycisphaerae bacterium]
MIIPIRTDYRRKHIPWVNYALVGVNIALFVMGYNASNAADSQRIAHWMLQPEMPTLEQFFTCTFLHANWAHLLGNMVFLWVFGNAINDKFGQAGYLAFYLAGGVLAGVGYLLLAGNAPVVGASGAIAAVAGAYLVLLPRTTITLVVFLFYFLWPIEVSSLYFLAIQFIFEIFMTTRGWAGPSSGGVAYAAHACGYLFGILVSMLLLSVRAITRDDLDLLHLIAAFRKRLRYRKMVASGYDPFSQGIDGRLGKEVASRVTSSEPLPPQATEEMELRQKINDACAAHNIPVAAELYTRLERIADEPVLGLQQQLDVANQFMADKEYTLAARAYERFVEHFNHYQHLGDIHLMLGLLYGRYLQKYSQAETCLIEAGHKLTDTEKKKLAQAELKAVLQKLPPV